MSSTREHNRKFALAKIIIWSLVAVVLLFALIMALMNATGGFSFSINSFIYANEASYNVGGREYTEDIHSLEINWAIGSLEILSHEADTIKIEETSVENEKDMLRSKIEGGKITVQYAASGIRFFEKIPEKSLKIYLPAKYTETSLINLVNINVAAAEGKINDIIAARADIDTAAGSFTMSNVSIANLEIDTASGGFEVVGKVDRLDYDGASGPLKISSDIKDAEIDAASSSIIIIGNVDKLDIDAASSGITLRGYAENAEIDTASGDITITMPQDVSGVKVALDTASGNITVNRGGGSFSTRYYTDNAPTKYNYEIDTASGNVTLNFE